MQVRFYEFDLPLRHVFTISRESTSVQKSLIVALEHDGLTGYGEATTNPYYGATIENMVAALENVRSQVEQWSPADPAEFWDVLQPALADQPFAHCALDQAAHDLWGKKLAKPVYELWGLSADNMPLTDYTIGIDEIDVMVAKLQEFPGWPIYKIKLGTSHDLEIIRQLRRHTDAVFRVDANCGWDLDEALRNAQALKALNVEFIEQPLPSDQWEAMGQLHKQSALPIIADESCITPSDVERCAGYFHGVNIKLVKCGGLTPARRMIQRARQLGLKTMVGCMTESSVGISAIAQLLPLLDYVDMDGALLLAEDIASGVTIERGLCRFPAVNGCGVQLTGRARGRRVGLKEAGS
jgi:L-alanine-DL-glutamate epimerase-like enolase superfamily enzyme